VALNALKTATTANDRYEVLKAVLATKELDTVVGKVTFDANGDAQGGSISAYEVKTSWPPEFVSILSVKE